MTDQNIAPRVISIYAYDYEDHRWITDDAAVEALEHLARETEEMLAEDPDFSIFLSAKMVDGN